MKPEILSLKSIYKFLTTNDYPVYSDGIIRKNNKRGLTINTFCDENILVDFKNRKNGKIIWRMEGARNRYLSEICNRSGNQSIHKEYAKEVLIAVDEEVVLRQIRQLMSFLLERQYNLEAFQKKLLPYVEVLEKEDACFSGEIASYFKKGIEQYQNIQFKGIQTNVFCCSWFLTYFMLFSLTGNEENENFVLKIKEDKNYTLLNMLKRYAEKKQKETNEVTFLTGKNTELSRKALGRGHFFGRQEELFELTELLEKGGQYLISGMGGSGKTELMRQFLHVCLEERLIDDIGIIQYEGSLAHSMIKAFPRVHGTELNDSYKEVLAGIQMLRGRKILLIIDNMDGTVDEKELELLCKLPATIFITSRRQRIKGLKTYRLKSITQDAAALIFRDNYGKILEDEDRVVLKEIVNHELWCHTLTLRLLARTARNNEWTLSKLKEKLDLGNVTIGYTESERYGSLRQVYREMYDLAKLTKDELAVIRMIAALPYGNYESAWITKYFKQVLRNSKEIEEVLESLWKKGWLEESETGYSMHPFISECVLSVPLTEVDCRAFFDEIIAAWNMRGKHISAKLIPEIIYENDKYIEIDAELVQTTLLIRTMLEKMTGRWNESYVELYLVSLGLETIYYGITKHGLDALQKIKSKTNSLSEITKVGISIIQSAIQNVSNCGELDTLQKHFITIKDNAIIPENMKYTFAENLGMRYYHSGGVEYASVLVDYVLENCKNSAILIGAYSLKAYTIVQKGDYEGYMSWLEKGIEIGREHGYEKGKEMQLLLSNLCDLYMALRMFDEAEKILEELEQISDNKSYFLKQHLLHRRGNLFMYRGDEGFGVEELTESYKLAQQLYRDTEQSNFAVVIVDLAMALSKAKRFDESAQRYQDALDIYLSLEGYDFDKHRILNNMSVMYLDRQMPETALKYLPDAYERGKVLGGLALGETANNLSKAYGALGERERELMYLKEAAPILEQFYGSEHPKVVDAKKRLEE